MSGDVLDRFSPATAAWFRGSFSAPTAAQAGAWEAISSGHHALVVAPTGSGKTLSAFLWALDRLAAQPAPRGRARARCRVLYVSPMKALAVDVERNLRSPAGRHRPRRDPARPARARHHRRGALGRHPGRRAPGLRPHAHRHPHHDARVAVPHAHLRGARGARRASRRSSSTRCTPSPAPSAAPTWRSQPRAARRPARAARPSGSGCRPPSDPVEEVARYLAGGRPVEVVQPPSTKEWDLEVVVPVPDMSELGELTGDLSGAGGRRRSGAPRSGRTSRSASSTSSPSTARRWCSPTRGGSPSGSPPGSTRSGRSGVEAAEGAEHRARRAGCRAARRRAHPQPRRRSWPSPAPSRGAPAVLARAHHGSVSKEQRASHRGGPQGRAAARGGRHEQPRARHRHGRRRPRRPGRVAAVGGQRAAAGRPGRPPGRRGQPRGALPEVPRRPRADRRRRRADARRRDRGAARAGQPRSTCSPSRSWPCAPSTSGPSTTSSRWSAGRRSFATLARARCSSRCSTCSPGATPATSSPSCAPRIVWDRRHRHAHRPPRRPAARRDLAAAPSPTAGCTPCSSPPARGPAGGSASSTRRWSTSRGSATCSPSARRTWRIEDITHDRVLVTPAPGLPGRLPFWKGDTLGRPAELGRAVGAFVREVDGADPGAGARAGDGRRARRVGRRQPARLPARAARGHRPRARRPRPSSSSGSATSSATGGSPSTRRSARRCTPRGRCASRARMRERFGVDVQAMHGDDGIVLRLPDLEFDDVDGVRERGVGRELLDLVTLDPDDVRGLVTEEIGGSALFAARFRECAARALLLPRRRPDRRQPLWQQRQRAAQLLEVASQYPTFPIVLEAVRECVQDVFDVPGPGRPDARHRLARGHRRRRRDRSSPSPFAAVAAVRLRRAVPLRGRLAAGRAPRRRPGARPHPARRAARPRRGAGAARPARPRADRPHRGRAAAAHARAAPPATPRTSPTCSASLGPLPLDGDPGPVPRGHRPPTTSAAWLVELEGARQVIAVRVAGEERWAAIEDAVPAARRARRLAAGRACPQAFLEPVADPLGDLVARYARTHGPFHAAEVAALVGLGPAVATDALRRLVVVGPGRRGRAAPPDRRRPRHRVLRRRGAADAAPPLARGAARRGRAGHRRSSSPASCRSWQGVGGRLRGREGLVRAVEQLSRRRRCRPAPSRPSCCPRGSPTTPPPCSTS